MFFRLLLRAATVRRGRALTALFAIAVAATLATALLSVYGVIDAKMSGDFRKFGANILITSENGFTPNEISDVQRQLGQSTVIVPEAFAIATTGSGKKVVVAGIDFETAKQVNSWWSVRYWPIAPNGVLVGERAAAAFGGEEPSKLAFGQKVIGVTNAGRLRTGSDEDSRVYMSLATFEKWTNLKPTVIEAAVPGSATEVNAAMARVQARTPKTVTVQPVRQIVEAETRVLGKTRFVLLLSTLAITLTVALCVLSTLTASVLERRKDYAVMKALGSSQAGLNAIFVGETLSLATLGATAGFAGGTGLAIWIGQVNFHTTVAMRPQVFPVVLAGCVAVALLSSLVPLTILQKTQPAAMLKGE